MSDWMISLGDVLLENGIGTIGEGLGMEAGAVMGKSVGGGKAMDVVGAGVVVGAVAGVFLAFMPKI